MPVCRLEDQLPGARGLCRDEVQAMYINHKKTARLMRKDVMTTHDLVGAAEEVLRSVEVTVVIMHVTLLKPTLFQALGFRQHRSFEE